MASEANDIRVLCSLPDHPKTKKLIRRLGPGGAWFLVKLFLWARENRPDGELSGMTAEDIELAVDWGGEIDALVNALVEVRFLDLEDGEYRIHDWVDHNPWSAGAKDRSSAARSNASKKWGRDLDASNKAKRSERLAEARRKATHSTEEWEALRDICGSACLRCGRDDMEIVKDHITPIYKGGSDGIENLQPICRSCNASKGPDSTDLRPANWLERLRERLPDACKTPATVEAMPAPSPSPSPSPSQELFTPPNGGVVVAKPTTPECPHAEIVALYHEILPELRRVRDWTPDRQAFLRARWREKPDRQDLGWWRRFFGYVRRCPWLMGEGNPADDREPFTADLEWLVRPKNFRKVIEGKYERRAAA